MFDSSMFNGPHANEGDLSIIVPAKNEASTITPLLEKIRFLFPKAEIIVVNNASTDNTAHLAATVNGVRVVMEAKHGKGHAMRCGAITAKGSVVMFHDADSEYSVEDSRVVAYSILDVHPEHRKRMMVIGVRAWRLSWLPIVSFSVNSLIRMIFWLRFRSAPEDVLTGTRCMSREVFINMNTQSNSFSIETEITRLAISTEMVISAFAIRYTPRKHSDGKKINWRHLPPIILEAFSRKMHGNPCVKEVTAKQDGAVLVSGKVIS